MTKERMEEEKRYLATMSIAKNLLKQGIISEEEYCQIDTKFKEQYAVSFSTLFTDINLINYGKCWNMQVFTLTKESQEHPQRKGMSSID